MPLKQEEGRALLESASRIANVAFQAGMTSMVNYMQPLVSLDNQKQDRPADPDPGAGEKEKEPGPDPGVPSEPVREED